MFLRQIAAHVALLRHSAACMLEFCLYTFNVLVAQKAASTIRNYKAAKVTSTHNVVQIAEAGATAG